MRAIFQVFIPLGLFISILLTPIYLRTDFEDEESDKIIESQTKAFERFSTISSIIDSSENTSDSEIKTTEAVKTRSSTTTTTTTTRLRTPTIATTTIASTITTITNRSTPAATTATTETTTTTTTSSQTTNVTTIITTTTTTTSTITTTRITTTTSTPTTTSTTTSTILTTSTTITTTTTTEKTTKITTTTTTVQDKDNPCPFECSSEQNCQIIVGDNPLKPDKNTKKGKIFASKQFRFNIGIDFPTDANPDETNLVHEGVLYLLIDTNNL